MDDDLASNGEMLPLPAILEPFFLDLPLGDLLLGDFDLLALERERPLVDFLLFLLFLERADRLLLLLLLMLLFLDFLLSLLAPGDLLLLPLFFDFSLIKLLRDPLLLDAVPSPLIFFLLLLRETSRFLVVTGLPSMTCPLSP